MDHSSSFENASLKFFAIAVFACRPCGGKTVDPHATWVIVCYIRLLVASMRIYNPLCRSVGWLVTVFCFFFTKSLCEFTYPHKDFVCSFNGRLRSWQNTYLQAFLSLLNRTRTRTMSTVYSLFFSGRLPLWRFEIVKLDLDYVSFSNLRHSLFQSKTLELFSSNSAFFITQCDTLFPSSPFQRECFTLHPFWIVKHSSLSLPLTVLYTLAILDCNTQFPFFLSQNALHITHCQIVTLNSLSLPLSVRVLRTLPTFRL